MTNKPYFTLVIPTCNRPDFIDVAVKIFLEGADNDCLCVICDASDTEEPVQSVLKTIECGDKVHYVNNTKKELGRPVSMVENWNTAMDNVHSEWVTFIGDDDVLDPEVLKVLRAIDVKHPEIQSVRWSSIKTPVVKEWQGELINQPAIIPLDTKQFIAKN